MDYRIVVYVTDQIIGHLKALKDGLWQDESQLTLQIPANYPSSVKKPYDVRIWDVRDPFLFYVRWSVGTKEKKDFSPVNKIPINEIDAEKKHNEAFDEACREEKEEEKRGQIAVHLKNLSKAWWRWLYGVDKALRTKDGRQPRSKSKIRSSRGKKIREEATKQRFQFKNMIIAPNTKNIDEFRDELRIQVGAYLVRDSILNKDAKWEVNQLFQEYIKKHFPAYLNIVEVDDIKAFNNLCENFKIPPNAKSFKNYLKSTLGGMYKKAYKKNESFIQKSHSEEDENKQRFIETIPDLTNSSKPSARKKEGKYKAANQVKINLKEELGSNFYARRYSGKMSLVMEKGRHIIPPDQEDELTKLVKEKRERKDLREIVKHIEKETGIKYKSIMRYVQRLKKQGINDVQDIRKWLAGKYLPELTVRRK